MKGQKHILYLNLFSRCFLQRYTQIIYIAFYLHHIKIDQLICEFKLKLKMKMEMRHVAEICRGTIKNCGGQCEYNM